MNQVFEQTHQGATNQPGLTLVKLPGDFPVKTKVVFELGSRLADIEKAVILQTLHYYNYNRTHTAKALGIGLRTLQRKLKDYGLKGIGLDNKEVIAS